ncbi:MAG: BON domain-containing protein [Nitrospiraceae bacterium]|nr:MAG: BON domain-containing protein [Nitrospiraceae bacterium]
MHTGKTQGKVLAGFVIAGALVLALPLPSQAQEKTFAGKSQSHLDPHYLENKADLQLKMDVKWNLALSPWVDHEFLHIHVRDGVVTLRGVVEDESAVAAAVRNAKAAGAKEVINKLTTEEKK